MSLLDIRELHSHDTCVPCLCACVNDYVYFLICSCLPIYFYVCVLSCLGVSNFCSFFMLYDCLFMLVVCVYACVSARILLPACLFV